MKWSRSMEYKKGTTDFFYQNTAVTLGKFDGIHRGHQKLIQEIRKDSSLTSVVFTFDLSPAGILVGEKPKFLFSRQEKEAIYRRLGVDIVIEYPVTQSMLFMSAEEFLEKILIKRLGVKKIVIGPDFCFGHNRQGNAQYLEKYQQKYGYQLKVLEKLSYKGKVISSSKVRQELEKGNMQEVEALLGHPYTITGTVVHGKSLGRTIGIPTINLYPPEGKLLPPSGVYESRIEIEGKRYTGMTNLGCKPTVGEKNALGCETHLLDYEGDLYEKECKVEFKRYIRPEKKFDSLEALIGQIQKDLQSLQEK